MPRQINAEGLQLVKDSEGLRLEKYQDVAGKWTIGYGHLILPNEMALGTFDEPITEAFASAQLESDLAKAEAAVESLVKAPLTDNEFAALVDFTFNLGVGAFQNSTMLKLLNGGLFGRAAQEFSKWIHAGGREIDGLVKRRAAEKALFLKADQ
jgi:GH24 family phage-related lysozyme (muramidase)